MIRIFLLLFFLSSTRAAAAADPSELHRACRVVSRSSVVEVPAILQKEVDACKTDFENFHCKEATAAWPELTKRLRKCDAASLCEGDGSPASGLYGWGKGMVNNTVDGAVALAEFAWKHGYQESKSAFEIAAKCDAIPACKRAVAHDVPWRRDLTDDQLKNIGSLRLASEGLVSTGLDKLSALTSSIARCAANPAQAIPSAEDVRKTKDAALAKLQAFSDWGSTQAVLTALRYHCVDRQGAGEIVGYTTAYVLDPIAVGGAVVKTKTVLEALSMSRSGLAEALLTGAKPQAEGAKTDGAELAAKVADRRAPGKAAELRRPADPTRQGFIDHHLNGNYATVKQNETFVSLAKATVSDGKTRFFDIENSVMKKLNDQTRDKNLVTSLTNRHKELIFDKLKDLQAKNPGLEIIPYSDFKSVRIAARGKVPADLEAQMQALLKSANDEFAADLVKRGLVRQTDAPQNWFRSGMGETADQANISARAAREQIGGDNRMLSFSSEDLQKRMTERLQEVETLRSQTARDLSSTQLLEAAAGAPGKQTLSREAFDLVRKYSEPEALQSAIQKRYGVPDFSRTQAESMLGYAKAVDEFSPGIHVVKREIVNLDDATKGGFSVDFLGLGSSNQSATAAGLARSPNLKEALVQTRQGEQQVTKEFQARIERFKKIAGSYAKCSGDDCIGVSTGRLSHREKLEFLNKLSSDDLTRGIRVSFVPEGVAVKADRTTLATHGESIEKFFRKSLEGKVPHDKMTQTLFAIDMQTTAANKGAVDLITSSRPGVKWTSKEWDEIQNAFNYAVEAHNKDVAKDNVVSTYSAMQSTCGTGAGIRSCLLPARVP